MQKHLPSPQTYVQTNCSCVVSMFFKSIGIALRQCVWKYFCRLGILSVGEFLTLRCYLGATCKQSLCSSDFFCSLTTRLVCIISGGYTRCDFYRIFSVAMICFPFKIFSACVNDTFLVLNESHDNRWRDSDK